MAPVLDQRPASLPRPALRKGTRVFVTNILDGLAEGASRAEIQANYPSLRPEHVDAAIAYAAELAREESLLPVAGL